MSELNFDNISNALNAIIPKNVIGNDNVLSNMLEKINDYNTFNKLILLFLSLLIFGLIYKIMQYLFGVKGFINNKKTEPVFLCNACNGKKCDTDDTSGPHDMSKNYIYRKDTEYQKRHIPSRILNTATTKNFTVSFWVKIDSNGWYKRRFKSDMQNDSGDSGIVGDSGDNDNISDTNNWKYIMYRNSIDDQRFGFWISPSNNDLWCIIHTEHKNGLKKEGIMIRNILLDKWFNISMVVNNRNMEVYINGKMENNISLYGYPQQSKGKLFISGKKNNLAGKIAYVQYFNEGISADRLYKLYKYYLDEIKKCEKKEGCVKPIDPEDPIEPCITCIYTE